jgi:hypothetical protein
VEPPGKRRNHVPTAAGWCRRIAGFAFIAAAPFRKVFLTVENVGGNPTVHTFAPMKLLPGGKFSTREGLALRCNKRKQNNLF